MHAPLMKMPGLILLETKRMMEHNLKGPHAFRNGLSLGPFIIWTCSQRGLFHPQNLHLPFSSFVLSSTMLTPRDAQHPWSTPPLFGRCPFICYENVGNHHCAVLYQSRIQLTTSPPNEDWGGEYYGRYNINWQCSYPFANFLHLK